MLQKNWTDLIKPSKLDIQPGTNPARQATIVAEPLERGFGLTLGNAMRRVLLSSLQGAAISSVLSRFTTPKNTARSDFSTAKIPARPVSLI